MEKTLEISIEKKKLVMIYSQLSVLKFQDPRNDWASRRNIKFFQEEYEKIQDKFWEIDEKYCVEENQTAKKDERGNLIIKREHELKAKKEREKILAEKVKVKYYMFQNIFKNGTRNDELWALPNNIIVLLDFLIPEDECPSDDEAAQAVEVRKNSISKRGSFNQQTAN